MPPKKKKDQPPPPGPFIPDDYSMYNVQTHCTMYKPNGIMYNDTTVQYELNGNGMYQEFSLYVCHMMSSLLSMNPMVLSTMMQQLHLNPMQCIHGCVFSCVFSDYSKKHCVLQCFTKADVEKYINEKMKGPKFSTLVTTESLEDLLNAHGGGAEKYTEKPKGTSVLSQ